jgi:hypothetical protein
LFGAVGQASLQTIFQATQVDLAPEWVARRQGSVGFT